MKLRAPTRKPIVCNPIWPNAGVQRWYEERLDELIRESFDALMRVIRPAWRDTPPLFAQDARSSTKALQDMMATWAELSIKKFDDASKQISASFAARSTGATQTAMMAQLKAAGFTVKFTPTPRSMEAYQAVVAENVGLIKSIPRKWHEQVEQKVWNAVRNGSDLSKLSIELRQTYGTTIKRAALIARDQNAKAKAVIERVRQMELGITQGIWMHSHAGKYPRPTHVAMNGKMYELKQGMYDSAVGRYIRPGEEIECKCSMRPVISGAEDEDDDGQPTNVELEVALQNAQRFADKPRAAEMLDELRKIRESRTTWMGAEENSLRRKIDAYLTTRG